VKLALRNPRPNITTFVITISLLFFKLNHQKFSKEKTPGIREKIWYPPVGIHIHIGPMMDSRPWNYNAE